MSTSKQLLFDDKARQALLAGVQKLAKAVAATLGPKGRNVAIDRAFGSPLVTKDGVTVAKEITLEDPYENMGAQMVKEVASKTADAAGDGTTTATVLAEAIYREGLRSITAGASPIGVQRGIQKAVNAAVAHLASISTKVTDREAIRQVATVSANWDTEIGNIIADAMEKVGKDGTVTVEESKGAATTLDLVEGMQFDRGYLSPYFADPETLEVRLDNPLVLIYPGVISHPKDMLPSMTAANTQKRSLLVIAEDVTGDALTMMVMNKIRGVLNVCAVKAPGFGDNRKALLEDIAALTGGDVISDEVGRKLESVTLDNLGSAKVITLTKDATTIIQGDGDKATLDKRVAAIRAQIVAATSDFEKEKLQERLGKLAGGVAVINVGATTEVEMKEKKARVEDALHATRAAVEEGIVPGGGFALLRCVHAIKGTEVSDMDEAMGRDIIAKSIEAPLRQLVTNAGKDGGAIVAKVLENGLGYNVATDRYEDLVKAGVVDPAKVTRSALQNAASVAGLLLTTECLITDTPKKESQSTPAPHGFA